MAQAEEVATLEAHVAELSNSQARISNLRERLFSLDDERRRLYDELLRVNQEYAATEDSLLSESTRFEDGVKIQEGLSKQVAESEVRAAEVRSILADLRSTPRVDPVAEASVAATASQAPELKDAIIARLTQVLLDFGSDS